MTTESVRFEKCTHSPYILKIFDIIKKMKTKSKKLKNGDKCKVIAGTHTGKSGTVEDINTSKTGALTITVRQVNDVRFKTLAKNVEVI